MKVLFILILIVLIFLVWSMNLTFYDGLANEKNSLYFVTVIPVVSNLCHTKILKKKFIYMLTTLFLSIELKEL